MNALEIASLILLVVASAFMARENVRLREDVARLTLKSCVEVEDDELFKKARQMAHFVNTLRTVSEYLRLSGMGDLVEAGVYIEEQVLKGINIEDCCSDCYEIRELRELLDMKESSNSVLRSTVAAQDDQIDKMVKELYESQQSLKSETAERERLAERLERVYLDKGVDA